MAKFYGTLTNGRGKVLTKCGTSSTGIRSTCETWDRKVCVIIASDNSCTISLLTKDGTLIKTLYSCKNIDEIGGVL